MPQAQVTLSTLLDAHADPRSIGVASTSLSFASLRSGSSLGAAAPQLRDRSIVLLAGDQLKTAAALIELDGWARRLVLCPPDIDLRHLGTIMRDAEADAIVHDAGSAPPEGTGATLMAPCSLPPRPRGESDRGLRATEWAMLTSGTTGPPKLALHTLAGLTGAIRGTREVQRWATFYDIRRYGGLQIFLRSVAGRGSLTLHSPGESIDDFLVRAGEAGITHISGTPSHWRLALMGSSARRIDPANVRLSGEIADASILAALSAAYPRAQIVHAYASTEAGVAFEVDDGQPGFPAACLADRPGGLAMKLVDGSLRIRSSRAALRYLGEGAPELRDDEGFVDTGDMIETRGDRCFFAGRRGGIINVGGAKVNPEEVEAVINQHAGVRASLVKGRRNPIVGAVVVADVVLKEGVDATPELKSELIGICERQLAPFKAPALIRFVAALAMNEAGKLAREG